MEGTKYQLGDEVRIVDTANNAPFIVCGVQITETDRAEPVILYAVKNAFWGRTAIEYVEEDIVPAGNIEPDEAWYLGLVRIKPID